MKRAILLLCVGFHAIFSSATLPALAESPQSPYTQQLIDLLNVFSKLDKVVAERMKANERVLLAKAMVRMSSGFYTIMIAKDEFVSAIRNSADFRIDYKTYWPAVKKLSDAAECLAKEFKDKGARIGALNEIDGETIERNLRKGTEVKVNTLRLIMQTLEIAQAPGSDVELKAVIIADGEKARDLAERLYKKAFELARGLDPNVILPDRPALCVKSGN